MTIMNAFVMSNHLNMFSMKYRSCRAIYGFRVHFQISSMQLIEFFKVKEGKKRIICSFT